MTSLTPQGSHQHLQVNDKALVGAFGKSLSWMHVELALCFRLIAGRRHVNSKAERIIGALLVFAASFLLLSTISSLELGIVGRLLISWVLASLFLFAGGRVIEWVKELFWWL